VLVSDVKGRDVKIDSFTLSFHGRLLVEGAEVALNYGQRYGLLGENGSGKVPLYSPTLIYRSQIFGRYILVHISSVHR
jgi:ABC-type hemin transport system ATPase subunit